MMMLILLARTVYMLEDVVFDKLKQSMIMFHGEPQMKRVAEITDRVVEGGIYNYWISIYMYLIEYISVGLLLLTKLMNITVSTSITCNLLSTSFRWVGV
jgi:hypothetical protein